MTLNDDVIFSYFTLEDLLYRHVADSFVFISKLTKSVVKTEEGSWDVIKTGDPEIIPGALPSSLFKTSIFTDA